MPADEEGALKLPICLKREKNKCKWAHTGEKGSVNRPSLQSDSSAGRHVDSDEASVSGFTASQEELSYGREDETVPAEHQENEGCEGRSQQLEGEPGCKAGPRT